MALNGPDASLRRDDSDEPVLSGGDHVHVYGNSFLAGLEDMSHKMGMFGSTDGHHVDESVRLTVFSRPLM